MDGKIFSAGKGQWKLGAEATRGHLGRVCSKEGVMRVVWLLATLLSLSSAGIMMVMATCHSVEEFNTVTGRWRSLADMPGGGRWDHSCVSIGGGQVLVAGGGDGDSYLDSALLYRVDTDQWRTAASFNGRRSDGEMVMVNGRILYMGGK